MLSHYPLVSFITVNYNSLADTVEFLESALKVTYPNIEIIVVDNNSPSGKPTEEIRQRFPTVKFIFSDKNLGFAGGNNLGISESNGEFLFFLNNDTILETDFARKLVDFFQKMPNAGAASPKILFPDKKTIQYAGSKAISTITGRGKRTGKYELDFGQYDLIKNTDLCHGSALIVPRKVIEIVGNMPEIYFLYYEEHDWCEQIKRHGYLLYYIGSTSIIHKESISIGKNSPIKTYYMSRNRLLYLRRNSYGFYFYLSIIFLTLISVPTNTLRFLLKGNFRLCKEYWKGLLWNINSSNV